MNASWSGSSGYAGTGAYTFNGTDSEIDIPSLTKVFGADNEFTFTAWIKEFNDPCIGDEGNDTIFTKSVAGDDNYGDLFMQTRDAV
jgi:hypothetical protein